MPSPGGVSATEVPTALATLAPPTPTPPAGDLSEMAVLVDTPSLSEDWW